MIIEAIKNFKVINQNQKKPNKISFGLYLPTLKNDTFERSIPFKGFPCSQDRFELKNLENIPCPSCGKIMIQNSELRRFVSKASVQKGEELIQTLHEYDNLYRPIEAQAVNEIVKMAKRFPESNLPALVQMAGIRHLSQLVKEQIKILTRIEGMGENLRKDEKIQLINCVQAAKRCAKLTGNEDGDHFGRKKFLSELFDLTANFSNEKAVRDIRKTAQKLPSSTSSLSAFFVKYSREDAEKIATRLLSPMTVTTEHIKPQSLGGEDNTSNYLVECMDCNSKRGNMPYDEWFKIQPEMPQNLQKYIEVIDEIIKMYDIKGYEDYISDIIETIKNETGGHILLDSPNEIEDLRDTSQDSTQTRQEKIKKATEAIEKSQEQVALLDKKIEIFSNDEEYQDVIKYLHFRENEEKAKKNRIAASKKLTAIKHECQSQQSRKNKLTTMRETLQEMESSTTSKKEVEDLKYKMSKLQEKISKDEDLTPDLAKAQEEYTKASEEYDKAKTEYFNFRKKFKLPEDYMAEETNLQYKIQERKDILKEIKKYEALIKERFELTSEIGKLKDELEVTTEENEIRRQKLDLNSHAAIETSKKYRELKIQRSILKDKNLDYSTLYVTSLNIRNVSLDFIAQKALQKIEEELEEIGKTEIGKYLSTKDRINEIENEIIEKETTLESMPKYYSYIKLLTTKMEKLNREKTIQELENRLEEVKARREALEEKFKFANIQTERDNILARISELTEVLQSLLKQGE